MSVNDQITETTQTTIDMSPDGKILTVASWASMSLSSRRTHKWGPNTLNHGNAQCDYCRCTDLEATVLGPYCV